MENIKKLILAVICIIIVLVVVIIILVLNKDSSGGEKNEIEQLEVTDTETEIIQNEQTEEQTNQAKQQLDELYDRSNYFNIKNNFTNYLENMYKVDRTAVFSMLSENYIEDKKITTENMSQYIFTSKEEVSFEILDLYKIQNSDVKSYAVKCAVMSNSYESKGNVYFIMNLDKKELTFSIEFIDAVSDLSNVKSRNIETIEKNDYNTYMVQKVTPEIICNDYIEKYKKLALTEPDELYNLLNKEYREARFGNVESFKTYINNNKEEISSTELYQYKKEKNDDSTMYICKDKKEKFYIINEKACMDFDIMLDAYTIELPQTKEAYQEADENEKLTMNIETIVMALNDDNYKYLYGLLEEEFKNSNFTTQSSFEKYFKNEFFENNIIDGDIAVTELNSYYKCTVKIANSENSDESKEAVLYIYMGEGSNFKMSFKLDD